MKAMRRKRLWMALAVVIGLFLVLAWYDGGREQPRLIEQPITLPGTTQ
ncbi:hypothetical protein [Altericroceibacterium endophyticum]|uniref:Uncharacterized protein n=1 Tax=Altericroceibacterium endophyticum TaxID=1808508 RepID=A0A6I4T3M7_9SPHN|nr:hypothetical protein [Altericroceibacterium endophyticum]MXO64751.1 hypothetical protein [Altericroceibacterium endophyticum]